MPRHRDVFDPGALTQRLTKRVTGDRALNLGDQDCNYTSVRMFSARGAILTRPQTSLNDALNGLGQAVVARFFLTAGGTISATGIAGESCAGSGWQYNGPPVNQLRDYYTYYISLADNGSGHVVTSRSRSFEVFDDGPESIGVVGTELALQFNRAVDSHVYLTHLAPPSKFSWTVIQVPLSLKAIPNAITYRYVVASGAGKYFEIELSTYNFTLGTFEAKAPNT